MYQKYIMLIELFNAMQNGACFWLIGQRVWLPRIVPDSSDQRDMVDMISNHAPKNSLHTDKYHHGMPVFAIILSTATERVISNITHASYPRWPWNIRKAPTHLLITLTTFRQILCFYDVNVSNSSQFWHLTLPQLIPNKRTTYNLFVFHNLHHGQLTWPCYRSFCRITLLTAQTS